MVSKWDESGEAGNCSDESRPRDACARSRLQSKSKQVEVAAKKDEI